MQVQDKRHRPNWDKDRLGTYFVRGIRRDKAPVGNVYSEKGDKNDPGSEKTAEIKEVMTLLLYNPKTKETMEVIIDPRHPQSRDQLKIAQDVIEGRVGGLTPVRMAVERASALDKEGNEVAGTEIDRVGEMESPAMSRGQTSVSAFGKKIGEWTPELDAAVDRAVSLKAAKAASAYFGNVEMGGVEWAAVQDRARAKLTEHWKGQIPDDAIAAKIALYEPQNPQEMFDGRFQDRNGREIQGAFDATREPPPVDNRTAEAQYFYQQSLVESFAEQMQTEGGGLLEATQGELMKDGIIPVKKPGVDPKIADSINYERARAVGAHLLGGYQQARGAAIINARLAGELADPGSLNSDVNGFMESEGLSQDQKGEFYLGVAGARSHAYHMDAKQGVKLAAEKCIKAPEDLKAKEHEAKKEELLSGAHSFLEGHLKEASKAVEGVETIAFM
jgi:hypothetical protein